MSWIRLWGVLSLLSASKNILGFMFPTNMLCLITLYGTQVFPTQSIPYLPQARIPETVRKVSSLTFEELLKTLAVVDYQYIVIIIIIIIILFVRKLMEFGRELVFFCFLYMITVFSTFSDLFLPTLSPNIPSVSQIIKELHSSSF